MLALPEPFTLRGDHIAVQFPHAGALFTTRRGGVSQGPYESLNLGRKTDDDPHNVAANRDAVERRLGVELAFLRQVHGSAVVTVSEPNHPLPEADGLLTATRGIGVAVLVADCLPIAIAAERSVAILHAGWRGLAAGVIDAGVRALRDLSGDAPLRAAIGPGAGPCCYEVGKEVHARFGTRGPTLDLKAIARGQLQQAGVGEIHDVGLCTMCAPELLFSHRRDRGVTGRQAGVAWLS